MSGAQAFQLREYVRARERLANEVAYALHLLPRGADVRYETALARQRTRKRETG